MIELQARLCPALHPTTVEALRDMRRDGGDLPGHVLALSRSFERGRGTLVPANLSGFYVDGAQPWHRFNLTRVERRFRPLAAQAFVHLQEDPGTYALAQQWQNRLWRDENPLNAPRILELAATGDAIVVTTLHAKISAKDGLPDVLATTVERQVQVLLPSGLSAHHTIAALRAASSFITGRLELIRRTLYGDAPTEGLEAVASFLPTPLVIRPAA